MADQVPEPLVPPEVDLRDFAFMPLEINRLRKSKAWLWAKRRPELGFYMLNLWATSWHETPAASLEDDDDVLADAAVCDLKTWPKVKEKVLHGWVRCSDGRLYHPIVAEKALEAWAKKTKQRQRTAAATKARQSTLSIHNLIHNTEHVARNEERNDVISVQCNDQRNDDVTSTKGQGREGNRQGREKEKSISAVPASKRISKNLLNGHEKDFDEFYAVFPKHVAKGAAQKAYAKALGRADPAVILDGARHYRRNREGEDAAFTKNPATWLNADCWLDEAPLADGLTPDPKLAEIEAIEAAFRKERGYE